MERRRILKIETHILGVWKTDQKLIRIEIE